MLIAVLYAMAPLATRRAILLRTVAVRHAGSWVLRLPHTCCYLMLQGVHTRFRAYVTR